MKPQDNLIINHNKITPDELAELVQKIRDGEYPDTGKTTRRPSKSFSYFNTNRLFADWGEGATLDSLNKKLPDFITVRCGEADDTSADEQEFVNGFTRYQKNKKKFGKKPDALLFYRPDYNEKKFGTDIHNLPDNKAIRLASKAKAELEIKTSSFNKKTYKCFQTDRADKSWKRVLEIKENILSEFGKKFKKDARYGAVISTIKNLSRVNFNAKESPYDIPTRGTHKETRQLHSYLRELKKIIKEAYNHRRTQLSITIKAEDLVHMVKREKKTGVPLFIIQVFMDKAYGIPFQKVLDIISKPSNSEKRYFLRKPTKAQGKQVIEINLSNATVISDWVEQPKRLMGKGEDGGILITRDYGKVEICGDLCGGYITFNKGKLLKLFGLSPRKKTLRNKPIKMVKPRRVVRSRSKKKVH